MRTGLASLLMLVLATPALAAERPTLVAIEPWSNVFGGKEAVFHFSVASASPLSGRAGWQLSANQRTLARGESRVTADPGQAATVEIRLAVPAVKEGVAFPATLSVSLFADGADGVVTNIDKRLWVFSDQPFAGRRKWLEGLGIRLFDPEKKTAECFEAAGIPFEPIHNVDSLQTITNGVLIVGQGVSFRDYRALPDTMARVAAQGVPVLCLGPSGGEMTLPGMGGKDEPEPRSLRFRKADVITDLDKRLDADAWSPDGALASHRLKVRGDRGPVLAEIEAGERGWLWIEAQFDRPRGQLMLCTFPIVEKWSVSPTPRFLLAALLEHMDGKAEGRTE